MILWIGVSVVQPTRGLFFPLASEIYHPTAEQIGLPTVHTGFHQRTVGLSEGQWILMDPPTVGFLLRSEPIRGEASRSKNLSTNSWLCLVYRSAAAENERNIVESLGFMCSKARRI